MPATMASSSGNDDDLTIPRAAINKMIKETLPNVRVANDARELVVNCCTEFIHLISSEANEICNKSDKKTISPEHVINGKTRPTPFLHLLSACVTALQPAEVTFNFGLLQTHRSTRESRLRVVHNGGEGRAAGVQDGGPEEEEGQLPAGEPGHPGGGAPQTAAGTVCQGRNCALLLCDYFFFILPAQNCNLLLEGWGL